jgi:REP element-mobilizing transposase RayT
MPANEKTSRAWPAPTETIEHRHHALRKGRVSIANGIYLVTTTTLDRQRWFADFSAGRAAARCMEEEHLLGDARMLAWVLMPDHLHALLQLGMRDELSMVVNRLKSATARNANRALRRTGTVWAKAFHDHALRKEEDLQEVARYIVANPLRAGLVTHIGDYPFWNAIWL